jgi:DNA polymerase I
MNKLIIIDGNAILHRAYHAYPPLTNNKGEVINAVYGFFSMFLSIITDQKPDYMSVCFDRAAPTFRQAMFAGYQQGRPSLPDDFIPQIALVHELLEKLNVSVFELDGYEADDLIGTLAVKAISNKQSVRQAQDKKAKSDIEVVIVTGDRDMLQLVNSHVKVLMPLLGITKTILFDEKAVEEKYGVKPSQFVDYKALIGDASDGYPGVSGIGPKGAANLLREYETFENLYENIPNLPEKVGLKLATDAEQAALAKKLAVIDINAPIQFDIKKCSISDFDAKALHDAFVEQGFKTLTKKLDSVFELKEAHVSTKSSSESKKEKTKPDSDQLELI